MAKPNEKTVCELATIEPEDVGHCELNGLRGGSGDDEAE